MASAHEHTAIGLASGYKLDICHFQQGVRSVAVCYLSAGVVFSGNHCSNLPPAGYTRIRTLHT